MAEYFKGTLLASPIVRGSSGDTYGTHHSVLGIGGYLEVNSISERNALPVDTINGIGFDGISSGQRRLGMLVYVHDDDVVYQLKVEKSVWTGLTTPGKLVALANNSNWGIFIAGEDQNVIGERITKQFSQITHGFVVGDAIGYDGTEFVKVSSLTAANTEHLGVVSKVIDTNTFNLTFSGYIDTTGILDVNSDTLSGGTVYYLSNVAGKISPTAPTGTTEISKQVLVALSADTGVVLQYRGVYDVLSSGGTVSYTEFTGYTASTQSFLDTVVTGATNLGYFTGYTGIQTLPINHLTDNTYDGNYISVYNNFYRDTSGYIRIGASSDGISRRGYVRSTLPAKSWIWNEYLGDGATEGWILVNADVTSNTVYGTVVTGSSVNFSLPLYTANTWTEGSFYVNGSQIVINTVLGNLTSGSTYISGGPIFRDKVNQELRLRSVETLTPQTLSVKYDDYFIRLSGITSAVNVANIGTGQQVFSGTSGTTLLFKSLVGGGSTTITDAGNSLIITSTVGGDINAENITKRVTQLGHGFSEFNAIGWSGGTYNKAIADGTYDGEIIGIVSNVVDSNNFDLTQAGYVTGLTGLVTDTTYYVSTSTPGVLTSAVTTTNGHLLRPMFVANSTTTGWVLPYQGTILTPSGDTGTTSAIYTGKTPSTCEVGGMVVGTTLTGRTLSSILEEILVPTINPTFVAPSSTFVKSPTTGTYEVGTVIDLDFTATFDRGSICLGASFQNYRSGLVNCYYYDGFGLPTDVSSTSLSDAQSITGYSVTAGTQTWNSCVGYDEGPQPLDSDGDPYSTPLASGITTVNSTSVNGIYPYFWGIESSGGAAPGDNRPTATNNLVTGGTKVVQSSTGTININFNSTSDDYLWFAIPSTSPTKTCWYVTALNNGDIGGIVSVGGNLFPDSDSVNVTTECWSGIGYDVYISNYQSQVTTSMEIRN